MRGAAAEICRDPEHVCSVDTCCVRRSKVMRDQNVRLGQCKKCLGSFSLQVVNYTFGDVLNIKRALSQVRVIDFVEGLGVPRGDFLENHSTLQRSVSSFRRTSSIKVRSST